MKNKMAMLTIIGTFLASYSLAAVYKEGKIVSDRNCKVEIVKMQWGKYDDELDRLIGKARRYGVTSVNLFFEEKIVLTFDVFNREAG